MESIWVIHNGRTVHCFPSAYVGNDLKCNLYTCLIKVNGLCANDNISSECHNFALKKENTRQQIRKPLNLCFKKEYGEIIWSTIQILLQITSIFRKSYLYHNGYVIFKPTFFPPPQLCQLNLNYFDSYHRF